MNARCAVLWLLVLGCTNGVFAQEIRPIAEFRLGGHYFFGDQLRLIESEGPYTDIMGIRGTGHGIFGEGRWSHGRNRDRAIALRLDLERTPFGHNWIIQKKRLEKAALQGTEKIDTIENTWTRNAVYGTFGQFRQAPLRMDAPHDLGVHGHWHGGLALGYEHRRPQGFIFGGEGQYRWGGYSIFMILDDPRYIALFENERQLVRYRRNSASAELVALAGHELLSKSHWRLDGMLLAGLAFGEGGSSGVDYIADLDTISLPLLSFSMGSRTRPILGLRVNGAYRLGNHDRLLLSIEARTSIGDYYSGYYATYPDPQNIWEPEGSIGGRLAYAGVRVGYAVAWGAPRTPRWMRPQER